MNVIEVREITQNMSREIGVPWIRKDRIQKNRIKRDARNIVKQEESCQGNNELEIFNRTNHIKTQWRALMIMEKNK